MVKSFKTGVYSVIKSFKADLTNKNDSVRVFKQTIDWNSESIGCFGLTTSQPTKTVFKLFQKHLSIKQSVVYVESSVFKLWRIQILWVWWKAGCACCCWGVLE